MDRWRSIASALLERSERPAAVLDEAGRIAELNEALAFLLGRSRADLLTASWLGLCAPDRGEAAELLGRLAGSRTAEGAFRVRTPGDDEVILFVTAVAVGGGETSALLLTVRASQSVRAALPHLVDAEYYEFPDDGEEFGRITFAWSHRTDLQLAVGQPCYSVLRGMGDPCPGCPARGLPPTPEAPRRAVIRLPQYPSDVDAPRRDLGLVTADRSPHGHVRVSVHWLDETDVRALVRARLDQLAVTAGLSERESKVFDLLIEGHTSETIGAVLEISPRTAKFHQANILSKLRVGSRLDLLRLVL